MIDSQTGILIAIEGGEGAGKTTLAAKLAEKLKSTDRDVVLTREPGGTKLGTKLRSIWLDPELSGDGIDGIESLFLFAADRHAHMRQVITPALKKGQIVITDRYVFSAKAYQASEGVQEEIVSLVCDIATGGLMPHRTYWLDLDPAVGLARIAAQKRSETASKYDQAELSFHTRVRAEFEKLAQANPKAIMRIDASLSEEEVFDKIYSDVLSLIEGATATN